MNQQTPAEGIMSTGSWKDTRSFRVACDCHSTDHDVNAWIEVGTDHEHRTVDIEFFVEGTTPFWTQGFSRIRAAWRMLVYGYHQEEHHLILKGQVARNFVSALDSSIQELEKLSDSLN